MSKFKAFFTRFLAFFAVFFICVTGVVKNADAVGLNINPGQDKTFEFTLAAKGTFKISCGSSSVSSFVKESGEGTVTSNGTYYIIEKDTVDQGTFKCSYSSGSNNAVNFYSNGSGTNVLGYSNDYPVISFQTNPEKILSVGAGQAMIGRAFPTLSNPDDGTSAQPSFEGLFKDAVNLTLNKSQSDLFCKGSANYDTSGAIYGVPVNNMFKEVFRNAGTAVNNDSISLENFSSYYSEDMFRCLTGPAATSMFEGAFQGANVSGTLGNSFFGTIGASAASMFKNTFNGNTGAITLSDSLFSTLNSGVSSPSAATSMFEGAFQGANVSGTLGNSFFGTIGASAASMFKNTFNQNTGAITLPNNSSLFGTLNSGVSSPAAAISMFESTFQHAKLTGTIGSRFFGTIGEPAQKMFYRTFLENQSVINLDGDVFGTVDGHGATSMFEYTFHKVNLGSNSTLTDKFFGNVTSYAPNMFLSTLNSTAITGYISPKLFKTLSNNYNSQNLGDYMKDIFSYSSLVTNCGGVGLQPYTDYTRLYYVAQNGGTWGGKVACGGHQTITLNNNNADTAGTMNLATAFNVGTFLGDTNIFSAQDVGASRMMGTSTNPITPPTKSGAIFNGYYSGANGTGTQYINSNGYVTQEGIDAGKDLETNTTWYANWVVQCYKVVLDHNGGSNERDVLYKKPGNTAWYSDDSCSTIISSISIPTINGDYVYGGYYDTNDGQVIDENGNLSDNWTIDATKTIVAQWTACTCTNGTGATGCSATFSNNQCNYTWSCLNGYYSSTRSANNAGTSYTATCTACPTNYPNSEGSSATARTQCYSNTKSRAWTGSQTECALPTNCYSKTCNTCSNPACDYVAYSNSAGTSDGTIKSGCSTNNSACQQTVASVTALAGAYVASDGRSCSVCSSGYQATSGSTATSCTECTTEYATSGTALINHDAANDCKTTITLNKNGGSGTVQSVQGTADASITCSQGVACEFGGTSALSQTGYNFIGGWGTENTCNSSTTIFTNPTGTYYACKSCADHYHLDNGVCVLDTYTITYKYSNNVLGTQSCTYGTSVNLTQLDNLSDLTYVPSSTYGWAFVGWNSTVNNTTAEFQNGQLIQCTSDITLYGIWQRNISFKYYNGADSEVLTTDSVGPQFIRNNTEQSADLTSVSVPRLVAHASYGWNPYCWTHSLTSFQSSLNANATTATPITMAQPIYYAVYSRTPVVIYNGNNATSGSVSDTTFNVQYYHTARENTTSDSRKRLAYNGFTKDGYLFSGWTEDSTSGTLHQENENYSFPRSWNSLPTVTMYAKWTQNIVATASNVSLTYNGDEQSCAGGVVVTTPSSGYTIMYRSEANGPSSSDAPALRDVGGMAIYYTVSADGYNDAYGYYLCDMNPATMNPVPSDNTKVYDGASLSCDGNTWTNVPEGSVINYSTDGGNNYEPTVPTITNVSESGPINWIVTNPNYNDATGTFSCSVTSSNSTITIMDGSTDVTNGESRTTMPNNKVLTVTCSNGATPQITDSGNQTIATATISGNTITMVPHSAVGTTWEVSVGGMGSTTMTGEPGPSTITVTCPATQNHGAASATYKLKVYRGSCEVTFNPNSSSGSVVYPTDLTFGANTTSGGTLSVASSNTNVASASIDNGQVTLTPLQNGSSTITVTSASTENYNSCSKTYTLTVNRGTCSLTLDPTNDSVTYPATTSAFSIIKDACCGNLSASSDNTSVATVSLNGTNATVSYHAVGDATITVNAAQTNQCNAASATYTARANDRTIEVNKNGGSGTCAGESETTSGSLTCGFSGNCVAPSWNRQDCDIAKTDKIFTGWNTTANATGTNYSGGDTLGTSVTVIYAKWADINCQVVNGSDATLANPSVDGNAPRCVITCNEGYQESNTYTGTPGNPNYTYICQAQNCDEQLHTRKNSEGAIYNYLMHPRTSSTPTTDRTLNVKFRNGDAEKTCYMKLTNGQGVTGSLNIKIGNDIYHAEPTSVTDPTNL